MNVGTGRDHTVDEYYAAAAAAVGYQGGLTHDLTKPVGIRQKLMDVSSAHLWGWSSKTSLAEGLAKTYAHYCQFRAACGRVV